MRGFTVLQAKKESHSYPLQTSEIVGRFLSVGETRFSTHALTVLRGETTGRLRVSGHTYDAP